MMVLLQLFISFFKVGLFSIGGGYAALPFIQEEVVELHQWISMEQFTDIVTISQMTPGPIAINCATFVGSILYGIPGSVIATLGCIAPSIFIVLLLAKLYDRYRGVSFMKGILHGLRPAIVVLIASAGLTMVITAFWHDETTISLANIDGIAVSLFIFGLFVLHRWKLHPILVMAMTGVIGCVAHSISW